MKTMQLTPEAVAAAPGPRVCFEVNRNGRDSTPPSLPVEGLAAVLLARLHRLPAALARLIAELAGLGGQPS